MITLLTKPIKVKLLTYNPLPNSKELYDEAVNYLLQSSAATGLLHFLQGHTEIISVLCMSLPRAGFSPKEWVAQYTKGVQGSLVTWCPLKSIGVTDRLASKPVGRQRSPGGDAVEGTQSPAMGLIHEFGHARQYLLKNVWFMNLFNQVLKGDDEAMLALENDNLLTVESVVARQLGEGVRWQYTDDNRANDPPYRVPGYYMNITGDPLHRT
jgi:hypothetical protein